LILLIRFILEWSIEVDVTMISHDFLCDELETKTTDKKLFFVYQRGLVQKNYTIRKIYTHYIQMLKTIQIVAMLQISKRQSPGSGAIFVVATKVSIYVIVSTGTGAVF